MAKFLCLQRSLPGKSAQKPSPSEMQEMYAKFNSWREKFQDQLVDMGGKLGEGTLVAEQAPTDGHFVEVKELVGGYMIVSAANLEEATQVARECPGLINPSSGCEVIEIHTP